MVHCKDNPSDGGDGVLDGDDCGCEAELIVAPGRVFNGTVPSNTFPRRLGNWLHLTENLRYRRFRPFKSSGFEVEAHAYILLFCVLHLIRIETEKLVKEVALPDRKASSVEPIPRVRRGLLLLLEVHARGRRGEGVSRGRGHRDRDQVVLEVPKSKYKSK